MNRKVLNDLIELNSRNSMLSMETHNHVTDMCSNPTDSSDTTNKNSLYTSSIDFYNFTEYAEKLLKNKRSNNSYAVLAFHIDKFHEIKRIYGNSLADELITHIDSTIKNHINESSLHCNREDNFAILLENYKSIDIAMLVIQLSEEISCFYPALNIKLAFGICIAAQPNQDITSLYKRALYAMSTIKGDGQLLLANYTDLIFS